MVIPVVLLLQFISGVYIAFSALPEWLQNVAAVFPLKWIAQGMRAAILPDSFNVSEPGGEWNLGLVAIMLAIWLIAGFILSRATFRWIRQSG